MARIADNRLLMNTVLGVLVYWVFGIIIPNPYVSSVASLVLLLSGSLLVYRYWEATYAIVVRGDRGEDADDKSSHLAVYGAWLVALGAIYTGIFGLWWVMAGQPMDWVGTATSGFGRALMSSGFVLMYWAPDAMQGPIRAPNAIILIVLFLVCVLGSFVAGANLSAPDSANLTRYFAIHGSDRPICPDDRTVWGTSRKTYHDANSQYRDMVIPVRCFHTAQEAEEAGFRSAD